MDRLRIELIQRICRAPDSHLGSIAELLDRLDHPSHTQRPNPPTSPSTPSARVDWPHAPVHRISEHGTFMVTAATFKADHFFRSNERLSRLESKLLTLALEYRVDLEAWAVFSNHYHFVAHVNGETNPLAKFLSHLHTSSAEEVNQFDSAPGRRVWYNFWDTRLTFEKSYFARLNYVHQNAVKHGLVKSAKDYSWCSASWFESKASPSQVRSIYGFKTDRLNIDDDYVPVV